MKKTNTKKKKTDNKYYVSPIVQKVTLYSLISIFILQLVITGIEYTAGPYGGLGLFWDYLIFQLLPISVFIAAYLFNPRRMNGINKWFESLILSITAIFIWIAGQALLSTVFFTFYSAETYQRNQAILTLGVVAVFVLLFWWMRTSKKWK